MEKSSVFVPFRLDLSAANSALLEQLKVTISKNLIHALRKPASTPDVPSLSGVKNNFLTTASIILMTGPYSLLAPRSSAS
mmetsp:Transcript_20338/g.28749  ORF Transcript_20338/g.28749 Transcript_20338/m.28749 type:complete len:80 (-) Transcript_20338:175-414(-)